MMYSRLKLARNLLKDDGVIFISIDDNEVDNLKRICGEVFGNNNFITTIIWQKVYAPKNSARHFSVDHDYILLFAKNIDLWIPTPLPRTEEQDKLYKNPDDDPRGPWMSDNLTARNYYGEGLYEVTGPTGKKFEPKKGRYWLSSLDTFNKLVEDNRIWWGKTNENMPRLKRFLSEVSGGRVPQTLWFYKEVGHTQDAKKELLKYVDFSETGNVLNSVKPIELIKRIVHISTNKDSNDIILDFFAGSGPTGQAVFKKNQEDGGNRKFILVQISEDLPIEEQIVKTISDLAKSRLKNVGDEVRKEKEHVDIGFRVLKVDSSNMAEIYYTPDKVVQKELFQSTDNIKDDRSPEDLLFQVLLDWGVDLTLPITKETIEGHEVFFVDGNALAACFENIGKISEDFCKKLAEHKPLRVVFRDAGFKDDSAKINAEQIFKLMSPQTDVKTI